MASPRALSGLVWLEWAWELDMCLEGKWEPSQPLLGLPQSPECTASSSDPLPTGWASVGNPKRSLCGVLPMCQAQCRGIIASNRPHNNGLTLQVTQAQGGWAPCQGPHC